MALLVVFVAIIYIVFGYIVMKKIDLFLEKLNSGTQDIDEMNDNKVQITILIFGNNDLTKSIAQYCCDKNIEFKYLEHYNELDFNCQYSLLLALSYNDIDNLTISAVGKKICYVAHTVSLCNDRENLRMYNDFGMYKIITLDRDISYTFNLIKELVDNETKEQA